MIDEKRAASATRFAISSSGNAALAALRHIQKLNSTGANLSLSIFVGKHIDTTKKARLESEITDSRITLETTERPLQTLLNFIKGNNAVSLRQSNDDSALVGYRALAEEISSVPNLSTIFIATSSGTTAQAIAEYFSQKPVAVYIVQTTEVAPMAADFTVKPAPEVSLADAIVDKVAHRRTAVEKAIRKTSGSGIIATNADILAAQTLLKNSGIEATANGALSLAGLIQARSQGISFTGSVLCIVTGK